MKHWSQKIKACNSKHNQRAIEQWMWIRGGGQGRFIIRFTLVYSLATMLYHELTDSGIGLSEILSIHFGGLVIAFCLWWYMEYRYKNARRQGSVNAAPTGQTANRH